MDDLGARLARGDQSAFAELYDACVDRVHHYLVVRFGCRHDADDVLQETFLRLARSSERLAHVENLVAYVFTVARNEAARLEERRPPRGTPLEGLTAADLFVVASDETAAVERAEQVVAALARLEPELREVVELKTFAGLAFREMAMVLELPQGTVATRYRTALKHLRAWLVEE